MAGVVIFLLLAAFLAWLVGGPRDGPGGRGGSGDSGVTIDGGGYSSAIDTLAGGP